MEKEKNPRYALQGKLFWHEYIKVNGKSSAPNDVGLSRLSDKTGVPVVHLRDFIHLHLKQ